MEVLIFFKKMTSIVSTKSMRRIIMDTTLEERGFIPMSKMTSRDMALLEKTVSLIKEKFKICITAKDMTIKIIKCKQCGKRHAICAHFHSTINGHRRPDLVVDVDYVFEICPDCGSATRDFDEVYETNPEIRRHFCRYCGRDLDTGNLKVFNRTEY